jgi:hypothetical protein
MTSDEVLTDAQIGGILNELLIQHTNGGLSFIGIVAVSRDGSSRRVMSGDANPLLLIGSFEYLKGAVLKDELEREKIDEHIRTQALS